MAANSGWFSSWFASAYFPPVWFAPSDSSAVPDEELRQEYRGNGGRRAQSARHHDHEFEALVREKWDAIEAARVKEVVAPFIKPAEQAKEPVGAEPVAEDLAVSPLGPISIVIPGNYSAALTSSPVMAGDAGVAAALLAREQDEAEQEDIALLLILAEA